jgi:predicted TIM-barrel fold metal-dependent hydrolase
MKKRIVELIDYNSDGKLLYGIDWPLISLKEYVAYVESMGFSLDHMEKSCIEMHNNFLV